jgi:hypothetical protein
MEEEAGNRATSYDMIAEAVREAVKQPEAVKSLTLTAEN